MKKRLFSMLLIATMVASLCACGNNAASTEAPAEESVVETEVAEEATEVTYPIVDEEITIRGLVVDPDTSMSDDRLVWQKVEEVTGINIEWEFVDSDALATYLAGGDWPDFFLTSFSDAIVNDYGVLGGRFVNLLDYMQYMPNLAKTYEDYPLAKSASTELNGEIYEFVEVNDAVTVVYSKPFYRTDLTKAAGITEAPKTIEEFKEMLTAVKEFTGEAPYLGYMQKDQPSMYWNLIIYSAFGESNNLFLDVNEEGKVEFMRTSDQMKHYYEFMNELYEEGLLHSEFASLSEDSMKQMELDGNVLLLDFAAGSLTEEAFESGEVELAALAPMTSEYDSTQTYLGRTPVQFRSGPFLNAESEYVVEMCKMFDIMYATEEVVEGSGLYGMSFTYGLEGVDWDYTETSYVQYPPEDGTSVNGYLYGKAFWNNSGRVDGFKTMVTDKPGNNQVRQKGYLENVIPYEGADYIWGLMKFTEDEQYVIDNKYQDIYSFYRQKEVEFITGVSDVETDWDAYCAEFEKMGITDLLEVYQSAYERFNGASK